MDTERQGEVRAGAAALRQQVLGPAHVAAAGGRFRGIDQLIDLATDHVWRDTWSRAGLEVRTRSLLTIGLLLATAQSDELELHLRGALRNGYWTMDELIEVCLHAIPYCGFPAARNAMLVLASLEPEADAP